VYFKVHNPNPYAVTLTTVSYGAISGGKTGCDATLTSNIAKSVAAPTTIPALLVPAGATVDGSIAGALTMPTTVADACQGATFDIQITISGASS